MNSFAVIPAAGKSARMGQPKLLMPWRKTTIIEAVISAWRRGNVSQIVAVVRPDDTKLAQLCREAGAEVVVAQSPPPEMKDSVRLALAFIEQKFQPAPSDAWLLAPADMPQLNPHTIDALLSAHDSQNPAILAPIAKGRRGHPVLFPWPLAGEVSQLADNEGVNAIVNRNDVRELPCNDAAMFDDIDTPEDYRRLQKDDEKAPPHGNE